MRTILICFALISVSIWALLFGVPLVNAWEQMHQYPLGHMCHSMFTFYVNTCRN